VQNFWNDPRIIIEWFIHFWLLELHPLANQSLFPEFLVGCFICSKDGTQCLCTDKSHYWQCKYSNRSLAQFYPYCGTVPLCCTELILWLGRNFWPLEPITITWEWEINVSTSVLTLLSPCENVKSPTLLGDLTLQCQPQRNVWTYNSSNTASLDPPYHPECIS
jgi:hypothetical protein